MAESRTQSERSLVVVDVVLVVAVADGEHFGQGHGHGYVCGHDLLRLLRDCAGCARLLVSRAGDASVSFSSGVTSSGCSLTDAIA